MTTFDHVWKKIGGRKFLAFVLALAAVVSLSYSGKLDDTSMWAIIGLVASFSGGNIGEHLASAFKSRKQLP